MLLLRHKSPNEASSGVLSWVYSINSLPLFHICTTNILNTFAMGSSVAFVRTWSSRPPETSHISSVWSLYSLPLPWCQGILFSVLLNFQLKSWKARLTIEERILPMIFSLSVYYLLTTYFLISVMIIFSCVFFIVIIESLQLSKENILFSL